MKQQHRPVSSLWAAAIALCVVLSVFSLFFASCAKEESEETPAAQSGLTITREDTDAGET